MILAQETDGQRRGYERGVVSIDVTYQLWDEDRPWAKQAPRTRTANAVVVADTHILTTAQLLEDATFLRLSKFGRPQAGEPRILFVDRDVNLALVEIDPAVAEGLEPVPVAEHTPASGVLRTVRWSGQQLESAASRIIRFEVSRSWGSRVEHAFTYMRTDMANGGWSEPVFDDGTLVGITVSQSRQESRAIPVEIIGRFLQRAANGGARLPSLGALWQVNRDSAVTRFLGQSDEPRGVVVRQVPWGTSACGVLRPLDVLLEIDGHRIDPEGFYRHPRLGQLRVTHLLAEHYSTGETIPVKVVRDGREQTLMMLLRGAPAALDLIPFQRSGQPPYLIAGGLVLRELDFPYLGTWGNDWSKRAPIPLLTRYGLQKQGQSPQRRRLVLITTVLPSEYTLSYEDLKEQVVEKVNGRSIGSLADVVEALENPADGFHVFALAPDSQRRLVVLDAAQLEAVTAQILADYQVPEALVLSEKPLPPGGGECEDHF